MANETEDKAWYESIWDWFGDTSKDIINSKLQSDQAKYEAELLAQQQAAQQNQTVDLFGYDVSKTTLLWIAGGSLLATLILVIVKK